MQTFQDGDEHGNNINGMKKMKEIKEIKNDMKTEEEEIEEMKNKMRLRKIIEEKQDDLLEISQLRYIIIAPGNSVSKSERDNTYILLLDKIKNVGAVGYYKEKVVNDINVNQSISNPQSESEVKAFIDNMVKGNDEKLLSLKNTLADAQKNNGPVEVEEAHLAIAEYYASTATKSEALEQFSKVKPETISTGKKIDVVLRMFRFGLYWEDNILMKKSLDEATKLMQFGGDWDRQNRLKVYNGVYSLQCRDITKASEYFLSCVATFTSYEIVHFNTFVFWTVISSIISLDRVTMKKELVDNSEILSIIHSMPEIQKLLNSFYGCSYKEFFEALLSIEPLLLRDRFFAPHTRWLFRELRLKAYLQFLEAYKSVTIQNMAESFGVSISFIDVEIAQFISSKRINARIDKVSGVIETNRADKRNAEFQQILKNGDALLNKLQKLARAVDV